MENDIDFNYIASRLKEFLENFRNDSKNIDYKYIRKIIKNWKIKDFGLDENGKVTNEYAIEELQKIISNLFEVFPPNMEYIILSKTYFETQKSFSDRTFISHLFIYALCKEIYNYYIKYFDKKNDEILVFTKLTSSMLDNYQGLLFSYLSGDFLTVMQKIRIIYEIYIIFRFINKNKELAKPFIDHKEVIKYNITKNIQTNEIKDDKYSEVINKYGDDFNENYGWTKNIIKNKNDRRLSYIANDLGIDENMNIMYKLTSNIIHTSSFSLFYKSLLNGVTIKNFLPLILDMLVDQIVIYIRIVCKDINESDFINIFMNGLKTKIFQE